MAEISLSRQARHTPHSKDPSPSQVSPRQRSERRSGSEHSQTFRDWTGGCPEPRTLEGQPLHSPKTLGKELHRQPPPTPWCAYFYDTRRHCKRSQGEGKSAKFMKPSHTWILIKVSVHLCSWKSQLSPLCFQGPGSACPLSSLPLCLYLPFGTSSPAAFPRSPPTPGLHSQTPSQPGTPASQLMRFKGSNAAKTLWRSKRGT